MSVIFEGVDMQKACCWVDGEHIEHCKFYNICKQRETIVANCKPSECPLKEVTR